MQPNEGRKGRLLRSIKQTIFECIRLTFFLFLLCTGQLDETTAVSTPNTHQIREKLQNPAKRSGNFDQQAANLEKRLRVGGTGTLAAIHRKNREEAGLFAGTMFNNGRKAIAAKTVFNGSNAAAVDRPVMLAQLQIPPVPESDNPEDLRHYIELVKDLAKKQQVVSIFA